MFAAGDPLFSYDDEHHVYRYDGDPMPSVSRILAFSGLTHGFYPKGAAERGTAIHNELEKWDRWNTAPEGDEPDGGEYPERLEGWKAFCADYGICLSHIEEALYDPRFRYCGRVERVATRHRDGVNECTPVDTIIDIKSGGKEKFHVYQLAGYILGSDSPLGYEGMCVYLTKTGSYRISQYTQAAMIPFMLQFRNMVRDYWKQEDVEIEEASLW